MHELSIANSIVDVTTEYARDAGAERIDSITLRIGALTCVHKNALKFSFELVTQGTLAEGAELKIIDIPVCVFCERCDKEVQLEGIQRFRCPECDTPSADIRRGNELEIDSIEIVEASAVEMS